jgi:hypothetical protein
LNFTNGYEWAYDSQTHACTLFGLDPWVEWCFGGAANAEHEYVGRAACIGQRGMQCDSWRNGGWTVEATVASPELPSCLPSVRLRGKAMGVLGECSLNLCFFL